MHFENNKNHKINASEIQLNNIMFDNEAILFGEDSGALDFGTDFEIYPPIR